MTDEPEETIGERIRRLRLERGLSQRELSEPGISYAYLSRIEAGQRMPSLKALRIVARKLGVSPEYIETGKRVPRAAERELRLGDAELELRLGGGDLQRAAKVFRREIMEADDRADASFTARARAGLGLIAAINGDDVEAVKHLETATESGYFPPETRPDLHRTLGYSYMALSAPHRAVELFTAVIERLQTRAPDDPTLHVRFAVYLASAYSALGDADKVRATLAEVTARADVEAASPQARIHLYWARARESWMEADPVVALDQMHRAIGLLESGEDTYSLALAHLASAQMLRHEQQDDEAEFHLELAERLLVLHGDSSDLGMLRAEQAKRAAARGESDEAVELATEGVRLVGDDARYRAAALHALGSAYAAGGDVAEAERYFRDALSEHDERRQFREASSVARELAKLLRDTGRVDEAFEVYERAAVLSLRQARSRPYPF
jgi:transcriptional regulator with XRE-family HTH domain